MCARGVFHISAYRRNGSKGTGKTFNSFCRSYKPICRAVAYLKSGICPVLGRRWYSIIGHAKMILFLQHQSPFSLSSFWMGLFGRAVQFADRTMGFSLSCSSVKVFPFPKTNNWGIKAACSNQLVPSAGQRLEVDKPGPGDSPGTGSGGRASPGLLRPLLLPPDVKMKKMIRIVVISQMMVVRC